MDNKNIPKRNGTELPSNVDVQLGVEEFGLFRTQLGDGRTVAILSQPTFDDFFEMLPNPLVASSSVVISPELITCAGIELQEISENRVVIEQRINLVVELSKSCPGTRIVLGTPTWAGSEVKPRNSTLVIQDGAVIAVRNKIVSVDGEESAAFDFSPSDEHNGGETGILICADLAYAAVDIMQLDDQYKRVFSKGDRLSWVHYYQEMPQFVSPEVKVLFVPMLWGVGSAYLKQIADEPQGYYRMNLFTSVGRVFAKHPNIEEIVVCDRTISEDDGMVSIAPYNYHFTRKD